MYMIILILQNKNVFALTLFLAVVTTTLLNLMSSLMTATLPLEAAI